MQKDQDRNDWLALQNRALAVALEGITIADARLPNRPLIYVNEGFERLTGFSAAEVMGRNCKFLQGDVADPATVDEMRQAMQEGRECTVEISNRRKDGTQFWNRLSITPVRDESGTVTHFIGIQSDVTARREAEEKLQRANDQMRNDL
ncbi:MAG: PAS domain-containing protein, partial [Candidatus Krumholzibacteria bacterium]|nr:PAS domain-containing protein [Candidatus Krumholzibacteria bacterium]